MDHLQTELHTLLAWGKGDSVVANYSLILCFLTIRNILYGDKASDNLLPAQVLGYIQKCINRSVALVTIFYDPKHRKVFMSTTDTSLECNHRIWFRFGHRLFCVCVCRLRVCAYVCVPTTTGVPRQCAGGCLLQSEEEPLLPTLQTLAAGHCCPAGHQGTLPPRWRRLIAVQCQPSSNSDQRERWWRQFTGPEQLLYHWVQPAILALYMCGYLTQG